MWPINYDDPNKFHISLGIGIIVASYILMIISANWYTHDFERYEDRYNSSLYNMIIQPQNETYYQIKINELNERHNNRNWTFITLYGLGFFILILGYIPYVMEHKIKFWKEWKKIFKDIKKLRKRGKKLRK